jgi:lipoate-protein ligase A
MACETGPKSDFSAPKNNQLLINALASVGIAGAQATGRNDMELEGRKISGAAFKHSNTTSLHHGTLLVDVEMDALSQLLNPNKAKLASKGVASVAARVVNLKTKVPELDHWHLGRAAINSFLSAHNSVLDPNFSFPQQAASTAPRLPAAARSVVTPIVIDSHVDHADFKQPYDELMDWSWRFGRTPAFTHSFETRFPWGVVDVNLQCEGGKITEALVYSDCLYTALIESVRLRFVGQSYDPAGVRAAMASVQRDLDEQQSPAAAFVGELCDWMVAQL